MFNLPRAGELVPNGEITEDDLMTQTIASVKVELSKYLDAILDDVKKRIAILIESKYPEYRSLLDRIVTYIDEIPATDDEKTLLFKLNEIQLREDLKTRDEGEKLVAQASSVSPNDDTYSQHLNEYLSHVTDTSRSRLAQYVIHRKIILELLRKRLELGDSGKYYKEEDIHKLIFPMRTTSNNVEADDQNLWLIDERLVYHYFLASDKRLKDVKALENSSIDRPDLLVMNRPGAFAESNEQPLGSIVVVEFKRPERTDHDQSPIEQVYGYINDIIAGKVKTQTGRTVNVNASTPFYAYIICDLTDKIRYYAQNAAFKLTPDGLGYFGFNSNYNAYIEIISFDKMLQDAMKRNRILFKKLQLPI
jgi:hypothetical protein